MVGGNGTGTYAAVWKSSGIVFVRHQKPSMMLQLLQSDPDLRVDDIAPIPRVWNGVGSQMESGCAPRATLVCVIIV